jgi:hypothetical protein
MAYVLAWLVGSVVLFVSLTSMMLKLTGTWWPHWRTMDFDLPPMKEFLWKATIIAAAVNGTFIAIDAWTEFPSAWASFLVFLVLMGTLFDLSPLQCIILAPIPWFMHVLVVDAMLIAPCGPPNG